MRSRVIASGSVARAGRLVRTLLRAVPACALAACAGAGAARPSIAPSVACVAAEHPVPRWTVNADGSVRSLGVWVDGLPMLDAAAAVNEGVAAWNHVRLPVRFTRVREMHDAEVRVRFVRRLPASAALESPAGVARLTVEGGALARADILLARETPDGVPFSRTDLYVTAIHELGHALGIGHGAHTTMAMAASTRAFGFTSADAQLAREAYLGIRCSGPTVASGGSGAGTR